MTCDLLTVFIPSSPPPSTPASLFPFLKKKFLCMFSVGLHKPGLGPGPYQGSQRYCDLHLTEDTQVSKSPEGSTSQVLLLINIAKHSKGIWIHFVSVSFFFLLIEIIYFICVQSFLWSVVFLYDCLGGKNDSYCRLYIYEFVNRKKMELWVFYVETPGSIYCVWKSKLKSKATC